MDTFRILRLSIGATTLALALGACGDDATVTSTDSTSTLPATSSDAMTTGASLDTTGTSDASVGPSGSDSESVGTTVEPTTDPSTTEEPTSSTSVDPTTGPPPAECGNAEVEDGEACDDGNDDNTDDCLDDCSLPSCGDGFVWAGNEECDDQNDVDTDECTNACLSAACGDGVVWEGNEECDDGNDVDDDGCSNTCLAGVCGDGEVQGLEECDDGNDVDTDECPSSCLNATCGDGFILENVELCDDMGESDVCDDDCTPAECGDGLVNMAAGETCDDGMETDVCDIDCTDPVCGDGVVNMAAGETCDDGNNDDGDGCDANCVSESKRAFVSSEMYTGNLGGLDGADDKCQMLADDAGLGGTWMAWVSSNAGSPSTRFTQSTMPYVRVDGVQIAANWTDLTDGTLENPLNVTELGGAPPIGNTSCAGGGFPTVWSSTNNNGTLGAEVCGGWTNENGGARWGRADQTNNSWTSWCFGGLCSWVSPIYCFEQ